MVLDCNILKGQLFTLYYCVVLLFKLIHLKHKWDFAALQYISTDTFIIKQININPTDEYDYNDKARHNHKN